MFDLLYYGYINLLKRAGELWNYLIAALSTDKFNWAGKFEFLWEEGREKAM